MKNLIGIIIIFCFNLSCQGVRQGGKQIIKSIDNIPWSKITRDNADEIPFSNSEFRFSNDDLFESLPDFIAQLPNAYSQSKKLQSYIHKGHEIVVLDHSNVKIITNKSLNTYKSLDKKRFDLTSTYNEGVNEFMFSGNALDPENFVDTELPGENEYFYYQLIEANKSNVYFTIYHKIKTEVKYLKLDYNLVFNYKKGSYDDLINGNRVELTMTDESLEGFYSYMKDFLNQTLSEVIKNTMIDEFKSTFSSDEFYRFKTEFQLFIESDVDIIDNSEGSFIVENNKIQEDIIGELIIDASYKTFLVSLSN